MKREERKKKVLELVEQLNAMRDEANECLGKGTVPIYVYNPYFNKFVIVAVVFAIIAIIIIGLFSFEVIVNDYAEHLFKSGVVAIASPVCGIIVIHMIKCWRRGINEVDCSKENIEKLAYKVGFVRGMLDGYRESRAQFEASIKRFERLKPIIVDELGGEFKIQTRAEEYEEYFGYDADGDYFDDDDGNEPCFQAVIFGEGFANRLTEKAYLELLEKIVKARELKQKIQELEIELGLES